MQGYKFTFENKSFRFISNTEDNTDLYLDFINAFKMDPKIGYKNQAYKLMTSGIFSIEQIESISKLTFDEWSKCIEESSYNLPIVFKNQNLSIDYDYVQEMIDMLRERFGVSVEYFNKAKSYANENLHDLFFFVSTESSVDLSLKKNVLEFMWIDDYLNEGKHTLKSSSLHNELLFYYKPMKI